MLRSSETQVLFHVFTSQINFPPHADTNIPTRRIKLHACMIYSMRINLYTNFSSKTFSIVLKTDCNGTKKYLIVSKTDFKFSKTDFKFTKTDFIVDKTNFIWLKIYSIVR